MMRNWLVGFLAAIAAIGGLAFAQQNKSGANIAGRFDYYVLTMSWSPSYCADPDMAARDSAQCGATRRFAFVVHGLWPQYERGWPERCDSAQPRDVSAPVKNAMLDIMPSARLIEHQWDKHGVCSGLSPQAYFDLTRQLRARVKTPPQYQGLTKPLMTTGAEVERAFIAANPGLTPSMIAVTCADRRIHDVRVCFTKDGRPRVCASDVRDRCGAERVVMPPVRGGMGMGK
jgi:ribonuclease T2